MIRLGFFIHRARSRPLLRAAFALVLAGVAAFVLSVGLSMKRTARATERLDSAAKRLTALTGGAPADNQLRAAIAWGYAERMRLGLESPFALVEAASADPRLTDEEQRTVSWALLAHIVRGETHDIDPATLDGIGPMDAGRSVDGEAHLDLIEHAIAEASNPRAGELAVRFAYTLGAAERILDGSAPVLAAEAAALIADRTIARNEAMQIIRTSRSADPIDVIKRRRARRALYVERPVLLAPDDRIEREAIAMAPALLDSLRAMHLVVVTAAVPDSGVDLPAQWTLAPRLYAAGARVPPAAALAVTVRRYLPGVKAQEPRVDADALARARNAEQLVAVTRVREPSRQSRRAIGRLLMAAAVSMRSLSQSEPWYVADTTRTPIQTAQLLGIADITFDREIPKSWHPFFLRELEHGVNDLRRVLPGMRLGGLHVRFRLDAPADSALAMHDPRTRTLQLPVFTSAGTLTHEIAHDLDRQSAITLGLAGYRSDIVARGVGPKSGSRADGKLAASLRALTEELSETPNPLPANAERPAEVFATRVDWFVASALARRGIASGFLSAVQDELLTGHVVHPERLRSSGRSRSLVTALEVMTAVAPFASDPEEPSIQTLLRWSLAGPVDRKIAAEILRAEPKFWAPPALDASPACDGDMSPRARLIRMAAESRARGWLRLRARWTPEASRAPWARATLKQAPWAPSQADQRVAELRGYILSELASSAELPAGLAAYAAPLALDARCAD